MSVEATPDRIAMWPHSVSTSDEQLRCAIEDELRSNPKVNETDVAVTVATDVVTLTGIVRTPSGLKLASRLCVYDSEMVLNSLIYPI